ncbi:uncharacterized protein LOC114934183 [Nylanderia fulva]|uniref:uncharacterized protein LOC114934183 n=1 Tax=Nylanderia fulva TaxID=613905 RepID=UPI0010FAD5BA|nr:uncharacterized protein LOC114934183 [Nylanderia fulva]
MERLRFELEVVAAEDPKNNVIVVKSITNEENISFSVPDCLQPMKYHQHLVSLPDFKKVKKTLVRRGQTRKVWFSLDKTTLSIYKDTSGNMVIEDYILEEIPDLKEQQQQQQSTPQKLDENLIKILEKLVEKEGSQQKLKNNPNLSKVSEKFVIDKFNGKNVSVNQWLLTYESECDRLGITKDIEKIEILRLFLEDTCKDWYSSMLIKHTLDSMWNTWKENFLETFADKGWSPIIHALNYRFLSGSLLDYALKKERLLLETTKT